MFKCAIVIAVLAASASLGGCTPTAPGGAGGSQQQEPSVASTNFHGHKTMHKPPQNIVYMPAVHEEHDLLGSSMYGALDALSVSKKMVGTAVGYFIGKLKSVDVKKIVNIALCGATIAVLGAVAVVAVSGLVSIVSSVYAMVPYFNIFFGHGDVPESHMDTISEFVLGAFDKYHKA